VLSINTSNYDLAPALTDPFRKRFGDFMEHDAIEYAVALDLVLQAIERAKSAKPRAVTEALHGARFESTASERYAAQRRAEGLRPVFAELANMSAHEAAEELNQRGIEAPGGGKWYAATVKRVRQRLLRVENRMSELS
jgi:hypothetical protein